MSAPAPAWALVPVKPPEAAKTRLAPALSPQERAELAACMAHDVLGALRDTPALAGIAVLVSQAEGATLTRGFSCRLLEDEEPGNLCASLGAAAARLAADGAQTVLIVPSDLPTLTGADVGALLAAHLGGVSVAPAARDGGTNALVLSPPTAIGCLFGTDSARRHLDAARRASLTASRLELPAFARDIDTVDDVLWLCAQTSGGSAREYLDHAGICERLGARTRNRTA